MRHTPTDPNADVLAEIADQNLEHTQAGQGPGTIVTSLTCYGLSWALGNDGNFCTATVECQNNSN